MNVLEMTGREEEYESMAKNKHIFSAKVVGIYIQYKKRYQLVPQLLRQNVQNADMNED